jgi:hypothetical protein
MLRSRLPRRSVRRRGAILVIVAVSLMVIVAIAALSIDGGRMLAERRQVQGAADAAALAGAIELFEQTYATDKSQRAYDPQAAALSLAEANGYGVTADGCEVSVQIPPTSGEYAGRAGYVEVTIRSWKGRTFSKLFGGSLFSVSGRAVAAGTQEPTKASVLVLDPKSKHTLSIKKGGSLLDVAGDVIVNSSSKKALEVGKGAEIIGDNVIVSGQLDKKLVTTLSSRIEGEVHQRVPPTEDPWAALAEPPAGPDRKLEDYKSEANGKLSYHLQPGVYDEKIVIPEGVSVVMEPGVYTLNDGLHVRKGGSLQASEVTLFSTSKKALKFEKADVKLTPPQSGPYTNVSLFGKRGVKTKVEFKKGASFDVQGVLYAPSGEIKFKESILDIESPDDEEEEFEETDEEEDFGTAEFGQLGASLVAYKVKIDKRSHVRLLGQDINAKKPLLRLVE